MEERLQKAFAYIDTHREDMEALLQTLVEIESPSSDKEALEYIASHLDTYCDSLEMERNIVHFEKGGPTFTASTKQGKQKPIALLGHFDTVHPVGSFTPVYHREGNTAYGPGIFDMKGGVVIALFVLRALKHVGYSDREIRLILSGDEEVAHSFSNGESGRLMEEYTKDCAAVFNCEPTQNGNVTIQRKGGAIFEVEVRGKAAHAGKEPEKGASAIRQAAYMIGVLEELSDVNHVLFNVGKIGGGKGANVIPDFCEFAIGIRYHTNEQYEWAKAKVSELCEQPVVKGTSCSMKQNGFYPAMEKTEKTDALLALYQNSCELLGQPMAQGEFQGGCSDSAFVSRLGIPVLCSCGIFGSGAHALNEHADVGSLGMQCKKLISTILSLPEEF